MLPSVSIAKTHAAISRERTHSATSPHTAQRTGTCPTIRAARAPVGKSDTELSVWLRGEDPSVLFCHNKLH